jgi:hypothetical protein
MATAEVIAVIEGRVIFRQYIPRKHKHSGIKLHKLCNTTGHTYNMKVCLGKNRQYMAQQLTVTHATMTVLTRK